MGIYGGSYGGFMTFMALFRERARPRPNAALRPADRLTQYNHGYTSNILNTPDDPEATQVVAVEYVDGRGIPATRTA